MIKDVRVLNKIDHQDILSEEALWFVSELHRQLDNWRKNLLIARRQRKERFQAGYLPDFDASTKDIRDGTWKVADIPEDMQKRVVEITGPVDRKMVINALNSGADCFMADFEDSNSPTWENCINGQINLRDAVNGSISLKTGRKTYQLKDETAKLMVRPRGLHMVEPNLEIDGEPVSASLFDFGLFFYHNIAELFERGETPAFYLPKLESAQEAAWWRDVFTLAEHLLSIPLGTIRATVLIETLPAAFQMDEILYQLRGYSAGLNAGRWDYIFSAIKTLGHNPEYIFPNRSEVIMETHMMKSYAQLLIETCHRRGIHAMGGMSAYIPRKDHEYKNQDALAKVAKDKRNEAILGHDGTWVAHPGLIDIARKEFNELFLSRPNQIERQTDYQIKQKDLLQVPRGNITYEELCNNVRVCLQYMSHWVTGTGCVPINYLMEDLATAEISRTQVAQWLKHEISFSDGDGVVDEALLAIVLDQETTNLKDELYSEPKIIDLVSDRFLWLINNDIDFMSNFLYEDLNAQN